MRAIRRQTALWLCTAAMVAALAGCNFDGSVQTTGGSSGSTGTPTFANSYYLSPSGSDQGAGTQADPWKTFAHALPALGPGDGLFLLDGTYDGSGSGYLDIDCSAGANNGLPGKPITVLALDERKAFLRADGSTLAPIMVSNCSDWAIQGLHAEYGDIPLSDPNYGGAVVRVDSSNDIAFRRMLLAHPDALGQGNIAAAISVASSTSVMVEDSELYDFPYDGIDAELSSGLILRRNYLDARGDGNPDGGLTSGDGISLNTSHDSILENDVVEGTNRGFFVIGSSDPTQVGFADDNLLAGDVALHCYEGFQIDSYCGGGNPACVGQEPHGTRLIEDVAYRNTDFGFGLFNTADSALQSVSALGNSNDGVRFIEADPNVPASLRARMTSRPRTAGRASSPMAATAGASRASTPRRTA